VSRDPVTLTDFSLRDALSGISDENEFGFVRNQPVDVYDVLGLFGDGGPGSKYPGHKDFPGSPPFDWTKEDHGASGPVYPCSTWRHFRDIKKSKPDVEDALERCDKDDFERHMHQLQDYFAHYQQGYRWWTIPPGHVCDCLPDSPTNPDNNVDQWKIAANWTRMYVDRWNMHCKQDKRKHDRWMPNSQRRF
jgi:hypothetical protein